MLKSLPAPLKFFPVERGVYEVAPGLKPLGENKVFTFDTEFARFRENKLACQAERVAKYFQTANFSPEVSRAVNEFLVTQLIKEVPDLFSREENVLHCRLTGETIAVDFAAICMQIQEDVAVVCRDGDKNWLAAIHLCSPSHWAAEDKIGKNFVDIHAPVPHIEKINNIAGNLVNGMISRGPFMRSVWGIAKDFRLNQHPVQPTKPISAPAKSPFVLRYERQVIWSLPEVEASVFFIRPYFTEAGEIRRNPRERDLLRAGLLSMSAQSREYKGIAHDFTQMIAWLDSFHKNNS